MIIQQDGYPLAVSEQLIAILNHEIEQHSEVDMSSGCTIDFRNPSFSASSECYHPVAIGLNHLGHILYLTHFAYRDDGHRAELVKELDFDFEADRFQHKGRDFPLAECAELFETWQSNFCAYYLCQVFNVTVQGYFNLASRTEPCYSADD